MVKKGTPNDIIVRLNEATNKALAKPSMREALAKIAADPPAAPPSSSARIIKSEITLWAKVVKGLRH